MRPHLARKYAPQNHVCNKKGYQCLALPPSRKFAGDIEGRMIVINNLYNPQKLTWIPKMTPYYLKGGT